MNYRIHTAIVLAAVAFAACARQEREDVPAPAAGTTRLELRGNVALPTTVYAFRREGDRFLFDTLFRNGWTPEGTLSVRMTGGQYKFLFAAGEGEHLALGPEPLDGLDWEQAAFTLHENSDVPGTCFEADELFLQFPAADAGTVYTVAGTDLTVPARLERAVSRIEVLIKRGYFDGDKYVEVPYAAPHNVLEQIERIELKVGGMARRVRPGGYEGTADAVASLAAADYTELTDGGFVRLDGPWILPPAGGASVTLDVHVVPAAGAAMQPVDLHLQGEAERNKRLEVRLWITADYPTIGVEIRLAPITDEQDGDGGIWE